eukprot:scaffold11945_cov84-Isochrysis_galbana.AAC.1
MHPATTSVVHFTFGSGAMLDFLRNWLHYVNRAGLAPAVAGAADAQMLRACTAEGIAALGIADGLDVRLFIGATPVVGLSIGATPVVGLFIGATPVVGLFIGATPVVGLFRGATPVVGLFIGATPPHAAAGLFIGAPLPPLPIAIGRRTSLCLCRASPISSTLARLFIGAARTSARPFIGASFFRPFTVSPASSPDSLIPRGALSVAPA